VGWHAVAAVPRLIAAGAEIDAADDAGTTPLMIAAGQGQAEAARAL
jgi:ankyrin repeat protein